MLHDCKDLHWNSKNQAECVICGTIHGEYYFPDLVGWFTLEIYKKRKSLPQVVARTFTLPIRTTHYLWDEKL